jgi:hypothetical protein
VTKNQTITEKKKKTQQRRQAQNNQKAPWLKTNKKGKRIPTNRHHGSSHKASALPCEAAAHFVQVFVYTRLRNLGFPDVR